MFRTALFAPLAAACLSTLASAQVFEARNNAMGGVGVASTRYVNAGAINPALLTRYPEGSSFGFTLPTVGAFVNDREDLIGGIEDFQDEVERIQAQFDAGQNVSVTELVALADQLQALDQRQAYGNVGGGLAFAVPSKTLAFSVFINTYADVTATAVVDPLDRFRIITAMSSNQLENLQSEGRMLGAAITDVGVAFAHELDLGGPTLSFGVAPKYQRVDTFNYSINVNTFDNGDFDDSQYRNDEHGFNLDAGVAFAPIPQVVIGLSGRNLISDEFDTVVTNGMSFTYNLDANVIAGAAVTLSSWTLAAEVDVTDFERFDLDDQTQEFRAGVEWDVLSVLQLRGGFRGDIENTLDDTYSFGVGVSPGPFHLDLAASTAGSDSYGAVIQMSFTL